MTSTFPDLLSEVRAFRAAHPDVRYVELICLDIPGHFYGKRYPVEMLEKVAACRFQSNPPRLCGIA